VAVELVDEVSRLARSAARERAVRDCSVERMVDSYLAVFDGLRVAAA